MNILNRGFYSRDTILVAQELLGKILVREIDGKIISGIITETEAYTDNDPACHAFKGMTESNKAMFGPVGHAYVYFIYGNYFCFNTIAKDKNAKSGGVLIRSIKPLAGIELILHNRKKKDLINLTNGPGKLTQALKITKEFNQKDITKKDSLFLIDGIKINNSQIIATPRIGISKAIDEKLRFFIKI